PEMITGYYRIFCSFARVFGEPVRGPGTFQSLRPWSIHDGERFACPPSTRMWISSLSRRSPDVSPDLSDLARGSAFVIVAVLPTEGRSRYSGATFANGLSAASAIVETYATQVPKTSPGRSRWGGDSSRPRFADSPWQRAAER